MSDRERELNMEIKLSKGENLDFAILGGDGLSLIILLFWLLGRMLKKAFASPATWESYSGCLICRIEDDTIVFYSVDFFTLRWRKAKELFRREFKELRSCAISYCDAKIHLRFDCGQHVALPHLGTVEMLKSFVDKIESRRLVANQATV